ncbi:MAG TPA: T9SS type A sorting domain-containing protein [Bacteroidales bacterium]|nr:T9SS type A sorting domain-containing protein [Bacteroidales bacterium]
MKKIVFLFSIASFLLVNIAANPLPGTDIKIKAFYFDDNDNWVLKLDAYSLDYYNILDIDTVWVCSSTECARINKTFVDFNNLDIITEDSLDRPLKFNKEGDSIRVKFYYKHFRNPGSDSVFIETLPDWYGASLTYGNYGNSNVPRLSKGQSIASVSYYGYDYVYYSLSNTITDFNDTTKMFGVLKGHIYDKNGRPLNKGQFTIDFGRILKVQSGLYSVKMYSRKYKLNSAYLPSNYNSSVHFKPIEFEILPDSTTERDIYLTDYVGVKSISNKENLVKIFPNPVKGNSILQYAIALPVFSSNCQLNIININGQSVFQCKIMENKGNIQLPQDVFDGTYTVQVIMNGAVLHSSQLIVVK